MSKQTLKFFYNGIKDSSAGNKLQKCHYSDGQLIHYPAGTITIYKRDDYLSFSEGIRKAFTVENNTDLMTDYFEHDRIRVLQSHPLYQEVKAAMEKCQARYSR